MPKPIHCTRKQTNLVHLADEGVDVLLPVTQVAALDEVLELAGTEATVGVAELEGPQEVGGLLEVGADGVDLVNQVLNADDAVLAQVLLNDGVVGESHALLVDLAVSALVDELLDALQVGVTVRNPRLDDLDHLGGSLGDADEDAVVDLQKTEELEDLAGLRGDLVDTVVHLLAKSPMTLAWCVVTGSDLPLDTDDEEESLLGINLELARLLGNPVQADLLTLSVAVLLNVLLSTLEDHATLLLVGLYDIELADAHVQQNRGTTVDYLFVDQTRKMVNFATALTLV